MSSPYPKDISQRTLQYHPSHCQLAGKPHQYLQWRLTQTYAIALEKLENILASSATLPNCSIDSKNGSSLFMCIRRSFRSCSVCIWQMTSLTRANVAQEKSLCSRAVRPDTRVNVSRSAVHGCPVSNGARDKKILWNLPVKLLPSDSWWRAWLLE